MTIKGSFDHIDYSQIPQHMVGGVRRYLEHGIRPGDFLDRMLQGNYKDALHYADDINAQCIYEWNKFLYNELPSIAWGTPEKVDNWIKLNLK